MYAATAVSQSGMRSAEVRLNRTGQPTTVDSIALQSAEQSYWMLLTASHCTRGPRLNLQRERRSVWLTAEHAALWLSHCSDIVASDRCMHTTGAAHIAAPSRCAVMMFARTNGRLQTNAAPACAVSSRMRQ